MGSVKLSVNTDGTIVNSKAYSDFGVRKYDDAAGRFLSIYYYYSRGWEKYLEWNAYYLDKGGVYKAGVEGPYVDIWYNGHSS